MTQVRFTFQDMQGNPQKGMEFTLKVKRASYYIEDVGVVLPEELVVTTDDQGQAIVNLVPLKAEYRIYVEGDDDALCAAMNWQFYVPDTDAVIDAERLYLVPPPRNMPWDEEAIRKLTQVLTEVMLHESNAEQSAEEAAAQVDLAKAEVVNAKAEVTKAQAEVNKAAEEAVKANAARELAQAQAVQAGASAIAAKASEVAAKASQDAASASAIAAKASQDAVANVIGDYANKTDIAKGSALIGTIMPRRSDLALAVGRSLQDKIYDVISVKDFGAKGDGVTDDYPAFQACFNWLPLYVRNKAGGLRIYIPSGEYRLSQQAVCNIAPAGTPTTGPVSVALWGDGPSETLIVATPENTTGLIRLMSGRNLEVFSVRHMAFLSDLAEDAATNNGIGLTIDSTLKRGEPGYGDQPRWSVIVDDLWFAGYGKTHSDVARRGNFMKGLYIADKYHPKVTNVRCLGRYSGNDPAGRTACENAIHMHACYSAHLSHIYVQGSWKYGIWLTDVYNAEGGWEDFRIMDSFVAATDYGVGIIHDNDVPGSGQLTEPGGLISGLHLNARKMGITIKNHHQVIINGLYAYVARENRADGELLPACVLLDNASDIMIDGQFLEPGFYVNDSNASVGVRIESDSQCIVINAQFGHGGIGVYNNSTATSRNAIMINAELITSRRLVASWAPFKLLVDVTKKASVKTNNLTTSQDIFEFTSGKVNTGTYPAAIRIGSHLNSNLMAGGIELSSINSAGAVIPAVIQRGRFTSLVSGAESSILNLFIRNAGATVEALRIQAPAADNDVYLYAAVQISGAPVVKRLKVGNAGTGPGGVGRALFVDN